MSKAQQIEDYNAHSDSLSVNTHSFYSTAVKIENDYGAYRGFHGASFHSLLDQFNSEEKDGSAINSVDIADCSIKRP